MSHNDVYYMNKALDNARIAYSQDEVPVGCVIVYKGEIIAESYNRKNLENIATYHAEILAIEDACRKLNSWYLDECILYTTVEHCMMCTVAIIQSRIKRVVYGTRNEAFGYLSKLDNSNSSSNPNSKSNFIPFFLLGLIKIFSNSDFFL